MLRSAFVLVVVAGMAVACQESDSDSDSVAETAAVTGTALYRERMLLPPNAVLEVKLEDVSRQDVAGTLIGETRMEEIGSPPYEFSIAYDPAEIDERMSYSVRARITVDDRLMFTTDTAYPVLTRGAGQEVELLLRRVPEAASASGPVSGPPLEGTYWKLTSLGGEEIDLPEDAREPHLILDAESSRAAGTGGCNRFSGGYELEGDKLSFGQLAMTMMACPEGTDVDRPLAAAMDQAERYEVSGARLDLIDGEGGTVASFIAREAE